MELKNVEHLFKYKLKIQIRFKDIDKMGHVNNAIHLTYFETVRVEYFKDIFRKKHDWTNTNMILAHTDITYKRPILLEDNLIAYTKISRFGTKSFDMENILVIENEQEKHIAAFGKSTLVCMNYNTKETVAVPKEWLESVKEFEGE